MLTKKQNLLETIKGGNPDRFVNQYEFMDIILEAPISWMAQPGSQIVDDWGVTFSWPEGQIGQFPLHDDEHKVLKDITEWKKYVKKPVFDTSDEAWAKAVEHANSIDRNEVFVTGMMAPGIFERCHHLMSMEDALMAFYEEPELMHELIDFITDVELEYAQILIDKLKPNAIFHHDDWGSQKNSFIAPAMFEEFFLPAYKKVYGFLKQNGIELIVHHNDSYSANLVPYMIEMGIDIWQGAMTTNNNPELIKKYGGKISIMGDIDSGVVDFPEWTREIAAREVERACTNCGKHYFIPCLTQGLGFSSFPGVYDAVSEEIDKMSKKMF